MLKKFILNFCTLFAVLYCLTSQANLPYYPIQFPHDDAAHFENVPYPVNNMTEWWYYNGRFTSKNGKKFGYYINYSYIRLNVFNKIVMLPIFMIQIADLDTKKVYGKMLLTPAKESHFSTQDLDLAFGKNITVQKNQNTYQLDGEVAPEKPGDDAFKFSLTATPVRDPLLIGGNGLIDMWDNTNSYYYSYTNLKTEGYFQINDEKFEIDPAQSLLWMDHQWGDFLVVPGKTAWFFALVQLDNNMQLSLALTYDTKTKTYYGGFSSIIMPDNSRIYTQNPKLTVRRDPGQRQPQHFDVSIPEVNLQLSLDSYAENQNVNMIYESASAVSGMWNGQPVKGSGNVESTVSYKSQE
jgi:predicted secreted hydrolase